MVLPERDLSGTISRLVIRETGLSWKKSIIYSIGLSIAFYFYFPYVVVDKLTIRAIDEAGPLLRMLKQEFGQDSARAAGYSIAFFVDSLATFIFIFPLGFFFRSLAKQLVASIMIVSPMLVLIEIASIFSGSGTMMLLEPAIGAGFAVLACTYFLHRSPRNIDSVTLTETCDGESMR
jgi:hypothetical protein